MWVKQQELEQQFLMLTKDQNLHGAKELYEMLICDPVVKIIFYLFI